MSMNSEHGQLSRCDMAGRRRGAANTGKKSRIDTLEEHIEMLHLAVRRAWNPPGLFSVILAGGVFMG